MITQFLKKITQISLLGILVLGLGVIGFTEEEKPIKSSSVIREIEGEISAIGKDYIAIIYKRDAEKGIENEIWLPMEQKEIKLVYKRSLDQLNVGDIVRVQYEEVTEEYKEGPRSSRKAKAISFVRPAEKKP